MAGWVACHVQPQSTCEQGKTVEDIISQWDTELEKRSRAFMAHASALADWDRAILANRQSLLATEEQLRKV